MDLVRDIADWIATGWGDRLGILFPLAAIGLVGLYILWVVIGYLRASQVGLTEGHAPREVVALPSAPEEGASVERPRGVPYCAADNLEYPAGARFCSVCERDLLLDCANCGTTISAGDASCYRCGTPTGAATTGLLA